MEIYHQKQQLLLCGLSAVNNLLQNEIFTSKTMNQLADQLPNYQKSFFNYHANFLKIGNYSADVLINALQQKGKQVVYFDKRQPNHLKQIIQDQNLLGFLLNKVEKNFLITSHHWFSILKKNEIWYNLDGKLKKYTEFGSNEILIEFLQKELKNNLTIFVVYNNHTQQLEDPQQQNNSFQKDIQQQLIVENQQQHNYVQMEKQQQIYDKQSIQNIQVIDNQNNDIQSTENTQKLEVIESIESSQQLVDVQSTENTQKLEVIESIESSQQLVNAQSTENTQKLEIMKSIENSQQLVNAQSTESTQKLEIMQSIENSQQIINVLSIDNSQQIEGIISLENSSQLVNDNIQKTGSIGISQEIMNIQSLGNSQKMDTVQSIKTSQEMDYPEM